MFLSDVKGDLAGLARAGSDDFKLHDAFTYRAAQIGFDDYTYNAFPVTFWDLYGEQGTRFAPRSARWVPCFWRGCWNCPTPRRAS